MWLKSSTLSSLNIERGEELSVTLKERRLIRYDLRCEGFQYKLLAPRDTCSSWILAARDEMQQEPVHACMQTIHALPSSNAATAVHHPAQRAEKCLHPPTQSPQPAANHMERGVDQPQASIQCQNEQLTFQRSSDGEIREAIKAYLLDPDFNAFVDRVEMLWDELEVELEEEIKNLECNE
ncbi:hypothetical protein BSKO_06260 [Bryopsis sp. KO-2023]|nr:hypothetical protein BSKO_06260 [Bryopsis sp. KO-2023]